MNCSRSTSTRSDKGVTIIQQKKHSVGIYCRLSQEDRNKAHTDDDSESIKNQKNMLMEYAERQGWDIYSIYSDDDFAGTDHSRPGFNRLLKDAESGRINIILCKTQSRFTRDMEDVEHYIHGLFPLWGVRFVSLVDNADTDIKGNKKSRQINAMVNEWYLEDMSENIRAVLTSHRKNGLFIGAFAPYGYKKDPADKHRLVIDEPAARMVREIFSLNNAGNGKKAIARMLNEKGIPCPSVYKNEHGLNYRNRHCKSKPLWREYSIADILKNEVYIGNMVQNKAHSISYKTKRVKPTDKSEWIKVENTHEPIIDRQTWELTRMVAESRRTPGVSTSTVNIFTGKLRCGICGGNLGRHKSTGRTVDYRCCVHTYDPGRCPGNTITERLLYSTVLAEFRQRIAEYASPDDITDEIRAGNSIDSRIQALENDIDTAERRTASIIRANKLLLEQLAEGKLFETRYNELTASYDSELEQNSRIIESCRAELDRLSETRTEAGSRSEIAERYLVQTVLI